MASITSRVAVLHAVGALLACISAGAASASDAVDSLAGVGLNVTDPVRSAAFYSAALGFKEAVRLPAGAAAPRTIAMSSPAGGPLLVLRRSDAPLATGVTGYGRIITQSVTARAVADRIRRAGFEVSRVVEAPNGPGSLEVWTKDPDGYEVEVFQPPAR